MRCLTAGFSHGTGYVAIIEGLPAGLRIDEEFINAELDKRQSGYGRSGRMKAERDTVEIIAGLINGTTVGAPLVFCVRNVMHDRKSFSVPRPGHADLPGALKYGLSDLSEVAESASGRETVMAVAVGAVCKQLLNRLSISISGRVLSVGGEANPDNFAAIIDKARQNGDTVGSSGEVVIKGTLAGLGSYVQRDRRFDGKLAGAIMSIPSIKSIEFGLGAEYECAFGSNFLDEFVQVGTADEAVFADGISKTDFTAQFNVRPDALCKTGEANKANGKRKTNYAGGIEGGMTNGEDIVFRFSIKPPPTVSKGTKSFDLKTNRPAVTEALRSDTCVAEAVTFVAGSVAAYELANEILLTFGSDTMDELIQRYNAKAALIASRLRG